MSRSIFITGASTGLGRATAILFQSKGWNVVATMRNPDKEVELRQLSNLTILPLDVTDLSQIESTIAEATKKHPIDVVFNNAGHGLFGPLESYTDDQITQLVNTNLLGVIRVTKAFLPHFRQQKKGLFINTSSMGGMTGFPFSSIYHVTKWGLEGFAESMSYELSQLNIQIKNLLPGGIRTDYVGRSMTYGSIELQDYKPMLEQADKTFSSLLVPENLTPPEIIAETVFEAATDGIDQLRYVAGDDGKQLFATRQNLGQEAFRAQFKELFFGNQDH
jgi:NAD(P)-dependent dehydrogenase (short-subunit alcohol dehydrogenase family)